MVEAEITVELSRHKTKSCMVDMYELKLFSFQIFWMINISAGKYLVGGYGVAA